MSFLGNESRKQAVFNCSKGGDLYAYITGLMFWVLTGLNMIVVAFVSHFFPFLQLTLAQDDLSYLVSSTFIEHRVKHSFCALAAVNEMINE